jgi:sugar lactone lactonase YvrE
LYLYFTSEFHRLNLIYVMKNRIFTFLLASIAGSGAYAQNIYTIAGGGSSGLGDGGPATAAELNAPYGVAVDAGGNVYLTDAFSCRIRRISSATSNISTIAGGASCSYNGTNMSALIANLFNPWDVALDASGNMYVVEYAGNMVRKIDASTGNISIVAGLAPSNNLPPSSFYGYNGDNIAANTAKLWYPTGVAIDAAGNIYISDMMNNRVRKVTASTGIIGTVVGTGGAGGTGGFSGDGNFAVFAQLKRPGGIALDGAGNLYIADTENNRIRKIDAVSGIITTVAGTGSLGFSGDGGLATQAQLRPTTIDVDAAGNIYFCDDQNSRLRKITAATGIITTIAGTGTNGYNGDNIPAATAQLSSPSGVCVDAAGNIYFSDYGNKRIRKIDKVTAIKDNPAGTNEFIVYPNPMGTVATLRFKQPQHQVKISLCDVLGKELRNDQFSGTEFMIEKGGLDAGVYFLLVASENGLASQKLIVE